MAEIRAAPLGDASLICKGIFHQEQCLLRHFKKGPLIDWELAETSVLKNHLKKTYLDESIW